MGAGGSDEVFGMRRWDAPVGRSYRHDNGIRNRASYLSMFILPPDRSAPWVRPQPIAW